MNMVLSLSSYIPGGLVSVSGMHAVYDPITLKQIEDDGGNDGGKKALKSLEIGGRPVEAKKQYLVALPHGIVEAIEFLENAMGNKIERTDVRDTGMEDWRVLGNYLQKHSPIDSNTITRGGRITVLQSDLALYNDEIELDRSDMLVVARVKVRNLGSAQSGPRTLTMTYDKTPEYVVDDPNPADVGSTVTVPPIAPGESVTLRVSMNLPARMSSSRVPLYFNLDSTKDDPNKSNDGTWVMAERDGHKYEPIPPRSSIRQASFVSDDF
jgi:hypothetical protein